MIKITNLIVNFSRMEIIIIIIIIVLVYDGCVQFDCHLALLQ